MSLVVPVSGGGPLARATPACNQLSGNSRGSPSVGPSTTNTAPPGTTNRSPSVGPSSTHKARPVTSDRSNPSIALTGTSNGCSPSVRPSSGYQQLPGNSRGSPSVGPSTTNTAPPGTTNRSPSVGPSSTHKSRPVTSNRSNPSIAPTGTSNGGSPSVRPSSGYQPPAGNSIGCSPSVRSSPGYQSLPGTSNRSSPSVMHSSEYQTPAGNSIGCSPLVKPSHGCQPLPGNSRGNPSVGPSTANTAPPGTSKRSPSEGPSSTHKAQPVTSNRSNPSIALSGTSNGCSPSVKPSHGYQPLPGTSNRDSPSSGYQPPAGNSTGCSPSVRPSSGYQTTHPPPTGTSNGCSQSVRTSSGFQPPPITSNRGTCSPSVGPSPGCQPPAGNPIVRTCRLSVGPSPGHLPPPGTSNDRNQSVKSSPGHQPPPGTSNGCSPPVRPSPGYQPPRSSHAYISSSGTVPACNPVAGASSAYNSSGPVPLGDQSMAVDLPAPAATDDIQPEVRAKPNRDRLSRKRKVRAVASTINQQVSSIHSGTVPVGSGEPKKFCARGSSLAMSSESDVAGGQRQLKRDPTSIENGREQAREKETSPEQDERELPFTSVLPREQTLVVPSRCRTDGHEKKPHSTSSRSQLKRSSDTLKEDLQGVATGSKVKRLATDGQVSTVSSCSYDRESNNETSICSSRAVNVRESPRKLDNCSRSPLRNLPSTSSNVLKPVSSKYPQGKEKSKMISEINEMQTCSSKIQSVQQSSENSQEVQICVPGLYRGRFRFVRRLYSQDSEDQSSQHGKSTGWKEECPFKDSEDIELSQFLLQPPCAPQVHPLLNRLEECQEDCDDDDGSDESDDTLLSCSSDETVFSSSGTSPCLGTSGGFDDDDDEDEELSQFLFQHPSLQIL
nr:mucin-1-like [Lytechinus pictus]